MAIEHEVHHHSEFPILSVLLIILVLFVLYWMFFIRGASVQTVPDDTNDIEGTIEFDIPVNNQGNGPSGISAQ